MMIRISDSGITAAASVALENAGDLSLPPPPSVTPSPSPSQMPDVSPEGNWEGGGGYCRLSLTAQGGNYSGNMQITFPQLPGAAGPVAPTQVPIQLRTSPNGEQRVFAQDAQGAWQQFGQATWSVTNTSSGPTLRIDIPEGEGPLVFQHASSQSN